MDFLIIQKIESGVGVLLDDVMKVEQLVSGEFLLLVEDQRAFAVQFRQLVEYHPVLNHSDRPTVTCLALLFAQYLRGNKISRPT